LNVFFQESTNNLKHGNITEAWVRVYVSYFRDKFKHDFARLYLCENQLVECPIVEKQNYTTDVHVFPSKESIILDNENEFPETVRKILTDF
jgi:hypothetical protein